MRDFGTGAENNFLIGVEFFDNGAILSLNAFYKIISVICITFGDSVLRHKWTHSEPHSFLFVGQISTHRLRKGFSWNGIFFSKRIGIKKIIHKSKTTNIIIKMHQRFGWTLWTTFYTRTIRFCPCNRILAALLLECLHIFFHFLIHFIHIEIHGNMIRNSVFCKPLPIFKRKIPRRTMKISNSRRISYFSSFYTLIDFSNKFISSEFYFGKLRTHQWCVCKSLTHTKRDKKQENYQKESKKFFHIIFLI